MRACGFLILSLFASCTLTARTTYFPFGKSTIALLDSADAADLSKQPDAYTAEHTPFDRAVRLGRSDATEADYLAASAANVRNWSATEVASLQAAFTALDKKATADRLDLHLPDTIQLIKTTAVEEFGAEGWTRAARIMLNPTAQPISTHLVAHELWHVISRYNAGLRTYTYATFGFKPCNKVVYKPAMHNRVITNPDCPIIEHYITVKDANGIPHDAALMLYSKTDFRPGHTSLGDYAAVGLLELTGDDTHKAPLLKNGEPVVLELETVPDFFAQVGTNTEYMLHIEEISAEHFAALMAGEPLPQMRYVEGLKRLLLKQNH
ncbi:MAG: hypothetical protein EOP52_11005 [Sphingobacteriales bacterium]|nr:MAG: hypothetical protein EOP52_11005 [Sphingobacteriales bacterium]